MKSFFLKTCSLLLVIFFQLSFLNVLFPELLVPSLPLVAVIAWTLILGFPRSLRMTVPLSILSDVLASGGLTVFSLYAVVLAYGTSFLSRRLLIERQGFGLLLYGFFSAGAVVGYQILGLVLWVLPGGWGEIAGFSAPPVFSFSHTLLIALLSGLFFIGSYGIVQRFEHYLEQSLQKRFSAVK